jgi:Fe-S-cluster containining protein
MDADGTPGVKLKTTEEGACLLLDGDRGCGVYADRPTVCRYYPVALLNRRVAGQTDTQQEYSMVREDHCKGHLEDRLISIADYRAEQGCDTPRRAQSRVVSAHPQEALRRAHGRPSAPDQP